MKHSLPVVIVLTFLASGLRNCDGSILVTATETGGNVVFSGGGTINLAGLTQEGSGGLTGVQASVAVVGFRPGFETQDLFSGVNSPSDFGAGGYFSFDTASGDAFGVSGDFDYLFVQQGYNSGDSLVAEMTFNGESFASMGLDEGSYVWTWGTGNDADSFTLQIGQGPAVPEPSTIAIWSVLGSLAFAIGRRRLMQSAA